MVRFASGDRTFTYRQTDSTRAYADANSAFNTHSFTITTIANRIDWTAYITPPHRNDSANDNTFNDSDAFSNSGTASSDFGSPRNFSDAGVDSNEFTDSRNFIDSRSVYHYG